MINVVQRLTGKTALITGAASGIGKATAERLAAEGARVALADLNAQGADAAADAIRKAGGEAISVRLDVTSEADWQTVMARVQAEWGRLDILVHCAGIAFAKPITDLDLTDWRRVMTTNLDGVFHRRECRLRYEQSRHPVLHPGRRARRQAARPPASFQLAEALGE
jgi:3-hydroxybutyrate dehydrogenase